MRFEDIAGQEARYLLIEAPCVGVLFEATKEVKLMREVEDVENMLGGCLKMRESRDS